MKLLFNLVVCASVLASQAVAQDDVLIIESQSFNAGHNMDTQWRDKAMAAGYTVTTGNQSRITNNGFFASTNVLVISSGVIDLPVAARLMVEDFLVQGGNVYLQAEYQASYDTNEFFSELVSQNGGAFAWTNTVSGDRGPVTASAPLDGPTAVVPLVYFWYGATGTGTGVAPALTDSNGVDLGWTFVFPSGGRLICNTDQDWVRGATGNDFLMMENMLAWLAGGNGGGVGTAFCNPGVSNSTGFAGSISLSGSDAVADDDLLVRADQLPSGQFAVFLASGTQMAAMQPMGSMGNLCLGGNLVFFSRPGEYGAIVGGQLSLQLPLGDFQGVPVMAGDTWNFQCWHRDWNAGLSTSNFSDGVSVTFN
ncbi:MAG: hypothetical protein P1V35_16185 [Planctomycetota bacterium]|nr:hypothetical protein [Planctomycetota bacterium]